MHSTFESIIKRLQIRLVIMTVIFVAISWVFGILIESVDEHSQIYLILNISMLAYLLIGIAIIMIVSIRYGLMYQKLISEKLQAIFTSSLDDAEIDTFKTLGHQHTVNFDTDGFSILGKECRYVDYDIELSVFVYRNSFDVSVWFTKKGLKKITRQVDPIHAFGIVLDRALYQSIQRNDIPMDQESKDQIEIMRTNPMKAVRSIVRMRRYKRSYQRKP